VRAAQALGIHAIRFESAEKLLWQLSSLNLPGMNVASAVETMH